MFYEALQGGFVGLVCSLVSLQKLSAGFDRSLKTCLHTGRVSGMPKQGYISTAQACLNVLLTGAETAQGCSRVLSADSVDQQVSKAVLWIDETEKRDSQRVL